MGKIWLGFLTAGVLSMGLIGCQDKVADERDRLWVQNRELTAQVEEARRARQDQPATVRPLVEQVPAPATRPIEAPLVVSPAPAVHQIAGLETTVDAAAGTTTVHLPSDIFFDSGKATLKDSANGSLDKVVAALQKRYAGKKIEIQGHTDTDPIKMSKWKSNQELSEARAKAVKAYLTQHGIDSALIVTNGLGDTKPRGAVKSLNRRVEIVVATR